jgi:hypothetical protein
MLTKQCSVGMMLVAILTAPTGLSARLNDPSAYAACLARKARNGVGLRANCTTARVNPWPR